MSESVTGDLAAFLEGRWAIERDLRDGAQRGSFRGVATFVRAGERVLWEEVGDVDLAGHRGPARRELQLVPCGASWEVRFDDGRVFHRLELSSGHCAAAHDCGSDRYEGVFTVRGHDAFDVVWRVAGPAKDQEIVSRYRRG